MKVVAYMISVVCIGVLLAGRTIVEIVVGKDKYDAAAGITEKVALEEELPPSASSDFEMVEERRGGLSSKEDQVEEYSQRTNLKTNMKPWKVEPTTSTQANEEKAQPTPSTKSSSSENKEEPTIPSPTPPPTRAPRGKRKRKANNGPTLSPTPSPTTAPPTKSPTTSPTSKPTPQPSKAPSPPPTKSPTAPPTDKPTPSPTPSPTGGKRKRKANNGSTGDGFPVDINLEANIAQDVLSITNHPSQSKVVIHLKSNATCPHPYVVGRLSGPVLIFMGGEDFSFIAGAEQDDNSTKLEGHYAAPIGGEFYIELTAIYCDYFLWNEMNILKSRDWNAERDLPKLGYDLVTPCTNNPWNMRLTGLGAKIQVDPQQAIENPKEKQYYGYWWNKKYDQFLRSDQPDSFASFFQPLLTRFQCKHKRNRGKEIVVSKKCQEAADWSRFDAYEWKWKKIEQFDDWTEPTKICFVGGSHARDLVIRTSGYVKKLTNRGIGFQYINAHYPRLATPDKFENLGCNKIIIAQVYWPHSRLGKGKDQYKHHRLNEYYQDVSTMIENLKKDPITKDMELYFRSAHMSPLGYFTTDCPNHKSIGTPMMVEAYNHVLRRVGQAHGVPFLEASSVVQYPMWDMSKDWNHLEPELSGYEALFYSASVTVALSDSSSK